MKTLKKSTLALLSLAGLSLAGVPFKGNEFNAVQTVKWGGVGSVVLTSTITDTVSDAVPMQVSGAKPSNSTTFAYHIKSSEAATSTVIHIVESKYCSDPASLAGCDSIWVTGGGHQIYGNQTATDTLTGPALLTTFKAITAPFQISAHNLFRIRTKGTIAASKTVTIQSAKLIGE